MISSPLHPNNFLLFLQFLLISASIFINIKLLLILNAMIQSLVAGLQCAGEGVGLSHAEVLIDPACFDPVPHGHPPLWLASQNFEPLRLGVSRE